MPAPMQRSPLLPLLALAAGVSGGAAVRLRAANVSTGLWGPCTAEQLQQPEWKPVLPTCLRRNLFYIKVPKTGSTTAAGVMRRIASRHGLYGADKFLRDPPSRPRGAFEPMVLANHLVARKKEKLVSRLRLQLPVLHVTFLREPIDRAFSEIYHFKVSRRGREPTPEYLIRSLARVSGSYETGYIQRGASGSAQDVLVDYDFVGVTERMDESLVVARHILGLPSWCDVLYVSAKNSSGPPHRDDTGAEFVAHVPLSEQPERVRRYVDSHEFRAKFKQDIELYSSANARLDRWIADIGPEDFKRQLGEFQALQGRATDKCGGFFTNRTAHCYWNDEGCRYRCLDRLCEVEGL